MASDTHKFVADDMRIHVWHLTHTSSWLMTCAYMYAICHAPVYTRHTLAPAIIAPHTCFGVFSCMARLDTARGKASQEAGQEGRGGGGRKADTHKFVAEKQR